MFVGANPESIHDSFRRSIVEEISYLATNGSQGNSTESSVSCTLLLDDKNLKDGKIPQLLGLCIAVWLVRHTVLWFRLLQLKGC